MQGTRLLPLSGIAFVALVLVAVIGLSGGAPEGVVPGAEVIAYFDDNEIEQFVATFVWTAAVPFLVLFALSVAAVGRRADADRPRVWERLLVGGSLLVGATLLVSSMVNLALVDGAANGASPAAMQALYLSIANGWVAWNAGLGVMMLGAAGTLLTEPRPYAWLGWAALPTGIALFFPVADFVGMIVTLVWIVVAGVVLYRAERATQYAAAPTTA
jgi:hypothetical protein